MVTTATVCLLPDCSGRNPLDGPLKGELERALAMAERFTQQYNSLLRRLEERMANTSLILDLLNREFGWVSSLANRTNTKDNFFQIQTVCVFFHLLVDTEEQIEEFSVTFPSPSLVIVLITCKQVITKTIFEKEIYFGGLYRTVGGNMLLSALSPTGPSPFDTINNNLLQ